MTINGASLNADLLARLNPAIMLIEEGAEILEPLVVAALPSTLQHLIMIGDHKQLRPVGAGCWVLGAGCWVLGAGCWVLGAGCWVLR